MPYTQKSYENEYSRDQALGNVAPNGSEAEVDDERAHEERLPPDRVAAPTFVLKTISAQMLWQGREGSSGSKKGPIMGLKDITRRFRNMETSAEDDDPWADQIICEIDDHLSVIANELAYFKGRLASLQPPAEAKVQIAEVELDFDALECEVIYRSALGWRVIALLIEADETIQQIARMRMQGLLNGGDCGRMIHQIGRPFRHLGTLVKKWKHTGVTRQDVREQTDLAKAAEAIFGRLTLESEYAHIPKPDKPASLWSRLFR